MLINYKARPRSSDFTNSSRIRNLSPISAYNMPISVVANTQRLRKAYKFSITSNSPVRVTRISWGSPSNFISNNSFPIRIKPIKQRIGNRPEKKFIVARNVDKSKRISFFDQEKNPK